MIRSAREKLEIYISHDLGNINMVSAFLTSKTANFPILIIRPISEGEGFVYVIFSNSAGNVRNLTGSAHQELIVNISHGCGTINMVAII